MVNHSLNVLVCALLLGGCAGAPLSSGRWAPSALAIRPEAIALLSGDDLGETPVGGFGVENANVDASDAAQGATPDDGIPIEDTGAGDTSSVQEKEPGFENEFPAGLGFRFGAIGYPDANTDEVPPRLLLGGYCHFGESETTRFEAGFDFTPDVEHAADSYYVVVDLHLTGFIGSSGSFFYRLGGGGIYENRGKTTASIGMLDVGGGVWLRVSEETGVFAGVTAQFLIGEELNVPMVVLLSAGIDF